MEAGVGENQIELTIEIDVPRIFLDKGQIGMTLGREALVRQCYHFGGTVDADYRGEIKVILVNLSNEDFIVRDGDRIAQMIISAHNQAEWVQVEELEETSRGAGGFGSTGHK